MKKIIVLILVFVCFLCTTCYSDEIVIDGDFSDWVDKPSINETDETDENESTEPAEQAEPETTTESDTADEPESDKTPEVELIPEQESTTEPESTVLPESASEHEPSNEKDDNKGPKYKISQLKWMMSENSDVLYIMIRLSHGKDAQSTEITTQMLTDYGNYDIKTNYDTSDGSVFTVVNGTDITTGEGNCTVINEQTVYLEYAIPIGELIKEVKWGYQIKIKVQTEDDSEPKQDYIIISTASTGPMVGVVIAALIAVGYYYFYKRKTT